MYQHVPTLLCYYFSYWSDVDAEQFELYVRPGERRLIFSFRTGNDLFAVFVGAPIEELPDLRRDIERSFMRSLDSVPDFAARMRAGIRQERFYGASDLPNFYRRPHGPGWALVGDAGLHKDPVLALGICDAFRDVALLADAISDGLTSRRPLDKALADYEAKRNEASAADYDQNIAEARLTPVPATVLALRQAVKDRPDDATQMIKARNAMIDRAAFFNPQNLQRLLGSEMGR
jgi:2-polyprenyl-6-methoxyphenol hydroxylase-like FAD-dependent oxidoreductase